MMGSVCARFLELAAAAPDCRCLLVQVQASGGAETIFRRVTRAQFAASIARVAELLLQAGVKPGDRVLWSAQNSLSWAALELACQHLGAVSVVAHPSTPAPLMERVVLETRPRLTVRDARADWGAAASRVLEPLRILEAAEAGAFGRDGASRIASAGGAGEDRSLATIMYTSGSTGQPKGAMLTHAGLLSNARETSIALRLDPTDVIPAVLSFSHSAGRTAQFHTALVAGATTVLVDRIDVDSDPLVVALAAPTVLVTVPRVLEHLMTVWEERLPEAARDKLLQGIRFALVGGASLAPRIAEALTSRGIPVYEAYGMTEVTCTATLGRPGAFRRGTVGRPLKGIELKIAEDGEVLCRGAAVMLGYHGDAAATGDFLDEEGWLHTGDLGRLDEAGHLQLTGRKKDLFLAADGNHFAPSRIEAILESIPEIAQAVAVGDGEPFVSALVVPEFELVADRGLSPHATCARAPICGRTARDLAECRSMTEFLEAKVDRSANPLLPAGERIRRLRLLERPFPETARAMTLSAKVKVDRKQIQARYAREIGELYAGAVSDLERARASFRVPAEGLLQQVAHFHREWSESTSLTGFDGRPGDPGPDLDPGFPESPVGTDELFQRFRTRVAHGSMRFCDRSYAGHMVSALPTIAVAAEALMAVLNQNQVSADASPSTTGIEIQCVRWLAELIGYDPDRAAGVGAAGGSIANLTALLAARNHAFPDFRKEGAAAQGEGVLVVSNRMHYSFQRAAEVLGLGGRRGLVRIPVDATNRMSVDALERELDRLDAEHRKVVALTAIAGTSETGNVDPIEELARIADERDIWLHVDAAMGAPAMASARHRPRFAGIERARSVTVDPHKWFYVPYHCAFLLLRERSSLPLLELSNPDFVVLRTEDPDLGKWSLEGSRAANAIKFWMVSQALGRQGYAALAEHQIRVTTEFAALVDRSEDFERLSVPELNILCFRFVARSGRAALERAAPGSSDSRDLNLWWNRVNVELQSRLQALRRGFFSRTTLEATRHGLPVVALRAVLFHPEIELVDLERLLDLARTVGHQVAAELTGPRGEKTHQSSAGQP